MIKCLNDVPLDLLCVLCNKDKATILFTATFEGMTLPYYGCKACFKKNKGIKMGKENRTIQKIEALLLSNEFRSNKKLFECLSKFNLPFKLIQREGRPRMVHRFMRWFEGIIWFEQDLIFEQVHFFLHPEEFSEDDRRILFCESYEEDGEECGNHDY